jgi:hypothetical protein
MPITVPAHYHRAVTLLQHASIPSAPVSPDDIVDCVELRTGKASPAKRQIITYRLSDSPRIKDRGKLIDIWV